MKEKLNNLIINPFIFYTFLVIYLELINKIFILKNFINIGLIYTIIFIIPIILIGILRLRMIPIIHLVLGILMVIIITGTL